MSMAVADQRTCDQMVRSKASSSSCSMAAAVRGGSVWNGSPLPKLRGLTEAARHSHFP